MTKRIVCFIILHYVGMEDTTDCVSSIMELDDKNQIRIVIVDNASPNDTGKKLKLYYKDYENIFVLLRPSNDGFSRANNDGVNYAKQKWDPDFYVITNNDVLFTQNDFIRRVLVSFDKYHFDVMGPDIYAPIYKSHQNPLQNSPPKLFQVQSTIIKNTVGVLFFPLLKKHIAQLHSDGIRKSSEKYGTVARDVCLKGACMIYSKEYVGEREKLFFPETFFYYEEFIQAIYCLKKKKTVIYDPSIQITHWDGRATEHEVNDDYKKNKYILKNMLAAAKIYRNMLLRGID